MVTVLILALAIGIKVWQAMFNIKTGEEIQSSTLKATGTDSRNDVISTCAVLLSILVGTATGLQLDGYMGCLVALFIVISESSSSERPQVPFWKGAGPGTGQ
jgi:divalent metal cation (Fe/Co/Zn/Cd) transporter